MYSTPFSQPYTFGRDYSTAVFTTVASYLISTNLDQPEPRADSMRVMADLNFWGDHYGAGHDRRGLVAMERAADDAMFILLSDIHLDKPQVRTRQRSHTCTL